jgi:hypothetical protein
MLWVSALDGGAETLGGVMAKVIRCEDGAVIRGETDEELLANAQQHMRDAHPDLAGSIGPEQLLAMATEE